MGDLIRSCLVLVLLVPSIGAAQDLKPEDCAALVDANAGDPSRVDERCFLITSVRIDESEVSPRGLVSPRMSGSTQGLALAQQASGAPTPGPAGGVNALIATADKITLIGQRIWNFIKDNRPDDEVSAVGADALPEGAVPTQLTGWSYPNVKQFRVVYTNLAGFDVVDFTYQVVYTYGGRIQGNKGHYLTNVQVRPGKLKVLWGFRFDFSGGAMKALNMGTQQNPVAAIELTARWRVQSVLVSLASSESFFIKGTGNFERISAEGTLP